MTTTTQTAAKPPAAGKSAPADGAFRLPDPEPRQDEKMTSAKHLSLTGNAHALAVHLGNPDSTIVGAELYIVRVPTRNMAGARYPDLLVSFDADPEAYYRSNGYIIAEQGKPPDFVLEIASPSTGRIDVTAKRDDYAALGIREYWRFDETGAYHGARLAGDLLVGDAYEAIPIVELAGDILQGHSAVLGLDLRWERGRLGLYVPGTGRHIATLASEQQARIRAEARIGELEAELRRLRRGQ